MVVNIVSVYSTYLPHIVPHDISGIWHCQESEQFFLQGADFLFSEGDQQQTKH